MPELTLLPELTLRGSTDLSKVQIFVCLLTSLEEQISWIASLCIIGDRHTFRLDDARVMKVSHLMS